MHLTSLLAHQWNVHIITCKRMLFIHNQTYIERHRHNQTNVYTWQPLPLRAHGLSEAKEMLDAKRYVFSFRAHIHMCVWMCVCLCAHRHVFECASVCAPMFELDRSINMKSDSWFTISSLYTLLQSTLARFIEKQIVLHSANQF